MAPIRKFEDIKAWQLARQLTRRIYEVSNRSPFCRDFGLKNQIRDAAGSVMHNIAEGFEAGTDAEFAHFLSYSRRSTSEVRSELYVAFDQNYINQSEFDEISDLAGQCKNTVNGLISYLKTSSNSKVKAPDFYRNVPD